MPYKSSHFLKSPPLKQKIWRYLDFAKFTALIQKRNLYFPSLSLLTKEDPWEGLPSKLNLDPDTAELLANSELIKLHKKSYMELRKTFYVNCWHMNAGESDSQWKIYGANPLSLAIVSDYERIIEAISDSREILGGEVIYYDPEKEFTSSYVIDQPMIKRVAFEHEKEFRLYHWDHASIRNKTTSPEGISITVMIEKLIEKIVITPHAPEWFVEVVKSLTKDYGFNIPINKSNLLEPLIY